MAKKNKPCDGLGPYEVAKIRSAVRQVWHRSLSRKNAVKRCTGEDGFTYCEVCKVRTPKIKIDHTIAVGDVNAGYIKRMFVNSKGLVGMCNECHKFKTKQERAEKKNA